MINVLCNTEGALEPLSNLELKFNFSRKVISKSKSNKNCDLSLVLWTCREVCDSSITPRRSSLPTAIRSDHCVSTYLSYRSTTKPEGTS